MNIFNRFLSRGFEKPLLKGFKKIQRFKSLAQSVKFCKLEWTGPKKLLVFT